MIEHKNGFKREICWRPAFDKRDPDPHKNYGIHGVEMAWYLHGPAGVIQFVVFTNWMLPHVAKELREKHGDHPPACLLEPMAADIGYHSPKPMYEGQKVMRGECTVLKGPCYYDGSSLNAQPIFDLLLEAGEEAVWKVLEAEYKLRFEEDKAND